MIGIVSATVDIVPLVGGLQFIGVYAVLEIATRVYTRRTVVTSAVQAESGLPMFR